MPFAGLDGLCAAVPTGTANAPVELQITFWFVPIVMAAVFAVCNCNTPDVLTV
jgi:hypothetical protein